MARETSFSFLSTSTRLQPKPEWLRLAHAFSFAVIWVVFTLVSLAPLSTHAQQEAEAKGMEIGIHAGPLMATQIPRFREFISGWGARFSVPTEKGVFELDSYFARGMGQEYVSGMLDYRLDLPTEILPVHALLGVHVDRYVVPGREGRVAGGWHFGGGFTERLAGPLSVRADFKFRFGPGNSAWVGVSLVYRLPSGSP